MIRKIAVPKSAQGGPRDQGLHEDTIKVTNPSKDKDKWSTLLIYGPLALPFKLVQV